MPGVAAENMATVLDSVGSVMSSALGQAQKSASTHRKNITILHKLFSACARITERLANGKGTRLSGEKAFIDALKDVGVNRIVTVKKGVQNADRCIKFVCGFIAFANEQAAAQEQDDSAASRLTSHILRHLLKGFTAKDKNVRFRCAQFVATMIGSLGELDNSDYATLKQALLERVRDKEAVVRVQAAVALSKLQDPEELAELDFDNHKDDDENPTKVLVGLMKHDPSAEVRRAALFQLTLHPATLPAILARTRDVDAVNRKLLYTHVLAELPSMGVLSLEQRNVLVKAGLKDREETVRKAARALVAKWAGDVDDGIIGFTGLFDVVNDAKLAEEAVNAVIELRQDLAGKLEFPETFWNELSPESALVARLFIAYFKSVNDEPRLEASLPVITALAFRLQDQHNLVVQLQQQLNSSEDDTEEAQLEIRLDLDAASFVAEQLLQIALLEDYGDEIGRRKMFTLIRDMISDPLLPAQLIPTCMDVLLKLSSHERDFMRVVVEIVQNIREDASAGKEAEGNDEDEDEDDEDLLDLATATAEDIEADQRRRREKAARKLQNQELDVEKKDTYLRCLALVRTLLERVAGSLQDNATLLGMVHELIVPSVRSKEPEIREAGLICLGLCSLLDKNMALDSFGLFVHQSQETEGELQVKIFQIVFDILMLYGVGFLEVKGHDAQRVIEYLLYALNLDSVEVQAVAAMGIAKLMLSGMITDVEVLHRLALAYFAPETVDNLELRQCLSYFFPVYCYSLSANQKRMQEVFIRTFAILSSVYDDLEEQSIMVTPSQLANQLIDWTDPQKAVATDGAVVDEGIQVELATDLLKEIYKETDKDTRKLFCQLLNKLYIPDSLDQVRLKNLLMLISQLDSHRPVKDTVSRNALTKFETGLKKRFADHLKHLDEEGFDQLEELLRAEYAPTAEFLEAISAENDEKGIGPEYDEEEAFVKKVSKKTPAAKKRVSHAPKARAFSKTPSVEPDPEPPADTSPRRSGRARKPAPKKAQPVIEEEDEESEEEESEDDDGADAHGDDSDDSL